MAKPVVFTDNYADHSTEAGYQFEFRCERCGNGYKSGFNASALGIGSKVARGLSGLLGGALGSVGQAGSELKDLTESRAKDAALQKATEEVSPLFVQCHRCTSWVCREICWNPEFNLCTGCAPKLEQEIAGMQSSRRLDQVREKVNAADYAQDVNVERLQVAMCPHCGVEAPPSGKFCGSCGQALSMPVTCGKCGTESARGTKFCPECGDKL